MECSGIDYGDVVRVGDDIATVHKLQCGHGEWTDDMALVHLQCIYMYMYIHHAHVHVHVYVHFT